MEIKTNIVLTLLNAAKAEGPWSQRLMKIKTNIVLTHLNAANARQWAQRD